MWFIMFVVGSVGGYDMERVVVLFMKEFVNLLDIVLILLINMVVSVGLVGMKLFGINVGSY